MGGSELEGIGGWENFPLRDALLSFEAATLFAILVALLFLRGGGLDRFTKPLERWGWLGTVAIGAGALLLATFFTKEWGETRVLLAGVTALSLVVALSGPTSAVCVLMGYLILRPWEVMEPNDVMGAIPKTLGWLCVGSLLAYLPARGEPRGWRQPFALLPFALALWLYLSATAGGDPEVARLVTNAFIPILVVYSVILAVVEERVTVDAIALSLAIAFTGIAWIAMYRTFGEEHLVIDTAARRLKAVGLLEDPNDASALGVMIFPFVVAFLLREGSSWALRIGSAAAALTAIVTIRFAQSRGALMGLFFCVAGYLVIRYRNRFRRWMVIPLVLFVALPVAVKFDRGSDDTELSTQSRFNYWGAAWRMALDNPVFGVGFGQFPVRYDDYAPENTVEWGKRTAHSSWALVLAEGGFPALLVMWLLVAAALREAWRVKDRFPELFCSALGYTVAISFLSQTYYLYPYALYALALGVGRIHGSPDSLGRTQMAVARA